MTSAKQQAKLCKFCDQPGASREHIVPQWVGRLLDSLLPPGAEAVYHHRSENIYAGIGPRSKSAKGPAYYTRAFCQECNNRWMSRLEDSVRPILEPMVLGDQVALDVSQQQLLAFWALKTVLAFHSIEDRSTHFALPAAYHDLYRLQAPLPYSKVWLGANAHGEPAWERSHSLRLTEGDELPGSFGATLTVGYVLFHVIVTPGAQGQLRLRYPLTLALREIWPGSGRSVLWPPELRAQPSDMTALAGEVVRHTVLK